jgi:hypothetical protein
VRVDARSGQPVGHMVIAKWLSHANAAVNTDVDGRIFFAGTEFQSAALCRVMDFTISHA